MGETEGRSPRSLTRAVLVRSLKKHSVALSRAAPKLLASQRLKSCFTTERHLLRSALKSFARHSGGSAIILDARPYEEYAVGHIAGARAVPGKPGVTPALYVAGTSAILDTILRRRLRSGARVPPPEPAGRPTRSRGFGEQSGQELATNHHSRRTGSTQSPRLHRFMAPSRVRSR